MVLVSILGDFHSSVFPIFYEFRESIQTHIVVYDDAYARLKENKEVVASLQKFCAQNTLGIETQGYQIDEDSFASIEKLISKIEEFGSCENIYINTTDGLSSIAVLLGAKLLHKGVKIISYDMYANSYNLSSSTTIEKKSLLCQMSIQNHLLFKGFHIAHVEEKNFAHKNAILIQELFEKHQSEFKELKRDITHNSVNAKRYENAMKIIRELGLNIHTQQKEITGGLFEWYIYLLVKDLGFDDIEVGVTIEDKFSGDISIRNEFDILLMKENHLHMIECKFTSRIDFQSLVYKYSNLINLIDDDGKMMILTEKGEYSHNLYDKSKQGLETYRRALANKIIIRNSIVSNKEKFIDDVKSYFSLYSK
jgi:hypothetical protein